MNNDGVSASMGETIQRMLKLGLLEEVLADFPAERADLASRIRLISATLRAGRPVQLCCEEAGETEIITPDLALHRVQ